MRLFHIEKPDAAIGSALRHKIDNLTKPKGSLGRLEELALQLGLLQQTLSPELRHPVNIIFAADHGIEVEGVSRSPRCITWQQMGNFLSGGAAINFLCRQHGFSLRLIDGGVDYDFPSACGIINRKIAKGTCNALKEPAMTALQCARCIEVGVEQVDVIHDDGCNVLSIGEMGIANTTTSSIWMAALRDMDPALCVGAGSGLDRAGIQHKLDIVHRCLARYSGNPHDVYEVMRQFGGFEMVMAVGAMLRAAELHMCILVDGFIMSACMLAASTLYPATLDYAVFCHCGDENGHRSLLDLMEARPLLSMDLRLGEGTGSVLAYPLLESAVHMLCEMDNFEHAAIVKYFT